MIWRFLAKQYRNTGSEILLSLTLMNSDHATSVEAHSDLAGAVSPHWFVNASIRAATLFVESIP